MRAAALGPLLRILHFTITSALMSSNGGNGGGDASTEALMAGLSLEQQQQQEGAASPAGGNGGGGGYRPARAFSVTSSDLVTEAVDLTKVMETLFTVIRVGSAAAQLSEAEVDAVSTAISTITVVVQRSGKEAWGRVSASFPLDVLVRLVLDR
jgi:hypothetical protein